MQNNINLKNRILILDDGLAGHYHQSQAIFLQLENLYKSRGIPKKNIISKRIKIKFKKNIAKSLVTYLTYFSGKKCKGCMNCLKLTLDNRVYNKLMSFKPNIIISPFGKRTVSVNLLLSKEFNSKSIVVMDPGKVVKKFDLAIIPRHDKPKQINNVVITEGAPNLISQESLEKNAKKLKSEIKSKASFKIGLLLGGGYKKYHMDYKKLSALVDEIKKIAKEIKADILVTTSRRTSRNIEELLKKKLSKEKKCKLLVIANVKNKKGVVEGILGLCDIVVVSPESVSMISEAASSKIDVIVFKDKEFIDKKHALFLSNLDKGGYIKLVDIKKTGKQISSFLNKKQKTKTLNDSLIIRKGLEKII